jgi:Pretoxin HINT domain
LPLGLEPWGAAATGVAGLALLRPGATLGSAASGGFAGDGDGSSASSAGGTGGNGSGNGNGWARFGAGTPVALPDGQMKPIEMVPVGDYVASRNETTGAVAARRVAQIWRHEARPALLLRFRDGELLETTKEHRIFVSERGFVGAGELARGMKLISENGAEVEIEGVAARAFPRHGLQSRGGAGSHLLRGREWCVRA